MRLRELGAVREGSMEGYSRDDIARILTDARDRGASEVHFKVPSRPLMRIEGDLVPTEYPAIRPQAAHQIASSLCAIAGIEVAFGGITEFEFSFGLSRVGRFRAVLYRQRGTLAAIVQRSALAIPELADLGLGIEPVDAALAKPGLIIVAGSQRSAAVAALVERFNVTRRGYIVTIEDPITYLHADALSIIAQRGVGSDIATKADGLRSARRQEADLVAVHHIEEAAAAEAALVTAEHRQTVIVSVAASSAEEAIQWLVRLRPVTEHALFEERLRGCLNAVVAPHGEGMKIT